MGTIKQTITQKVDCDFGTVKGETGIGKKLRVDLIGQFIWMMIWSVKKFDMMNYRSRYLI